ncbi:M56 family metallopeptidase [Hymenobacter norwichensis]|uniref:M56 family metallopeptidase n=1 Tax=Hymenobacter norwichensis TaxID=223903 RepID=UPI0003B4ABA2|nr:M56 family metallopeptidase [Hymenobacter norwichensis]
MPHLLEYLLQVNGALLLFVAVYYALLRRLTFHTLNRWYLLGAVAFSVLYPLIDMAALWPRPAVLDTELLIWQSVWPGAPAAAPAPAPVDYYSWVLRLYWVGVAVLAGRLLMQGVSLGRLHRLARPVAQGVLFREVPEAVTPFSFWQTIYLNPTQHQPTELAAILLHEQVHIRQWHTLDVLLGQVLRVFCWPNPAAWLLLRAVQENLEFIADHAVLTESALGKQDYQYSLVRLSTLAQGPALVLPFSFITLKSRITMMNSPQSSRLQLSRYLLALPLAFGLALSFSASKAGSVSLIAAASEVHITDIEKPAPISALPPAALAYIVQQYPGYRLIGVAEVRATDDSNPRYRAEIAIGRRPMQLLFTAKGQVLPTAVAEQLYFLDGKPISKAEIDKLDPKTVSHMMVLKKEEALRSFGPGATAGAVLIVTKGKENSEEVLAFMREHNMTLTPASPEVNKINSAVVDGKGLSEEDLGGRLLIVNGQEAPVAASKIAAGRLKTVGVLDAKKATAKYGAKGKNGAVVITTN